MNLICSEKSKKCECREDMKWNMEKGECQVYINVDCSIFDYDWRDFSISDLMASPTEISISTNDAGNDVGEIDPEKEEALAVELNPKWYGCKDDPRGAFDAGHVGFDLLQH